RIPQARAQALENRRRSMSGRSGCGVCGSELLEGAMRWPAPVRADPRVTVQALRRALGELKSAQAINARTGATDAAGWASLDGALQLARGDVGRHNALDKLIGAMHAAGHDPAGGFPSVTSRARYGMAIKARTGATHAAGSASLAGALQLAREDVGRNNALDKLIGAMHAAGHDRADGFLVVTSRASYEMAMKAASVGIALMAAVSAPTA